MDLIGSITSLIEIIKIAVSIFGFLALLVIIIGTIAGITQVAWRFGLALFGKKVIIVADDSAYKDLKEDFTYSGLIKEKNIIQASTNHLEKTKDALLIIIVYGYLNEDDFKQVVSNKKGRCGLIVYCPPNKDCALGRLSEEEMELVSKSTFSALCNFRGRLVNDVLLMMLSTSFKKVDLHKQ